MQLPDTTLDVLVELIDVLEKNEVQDRWPAVNHAQEILDKYTPPADRIFVPGKLTDFETVLFLQGEVEELRKNRVALVKQIEGHLAFQDKLNLIIDDLNEDQNVLKRRINELMNFKSGERNKILKDKVLAKLKKENDELMKSNAQLRKLNNQLLSKKYGQKG